MNGQGNCGTYTNGIIVNVILNIKKNAFESVLMRRMKLEPIIQSEVSWKEKHQYSILTHIYGIKKNGSENAICKATKETQM